MTTDVLDFSGYDEFAIDFSFYPVSMDNSNEDFWFQISTNGGSTFTTVEEWNRDDEFVNNVRYNDQVVVAGPFTSSTLLRFRCDASTNGDRVYIDDVVISACNSAGAATAEKRNETDVTSQEFQKDIPILSNINLFPNPVDNQLVLTFDANKNELLEMIVTDISGQVFNYLKIEAITGSNKLMIETGSLKSGYYFVTFVTNGHSVIRKIVVTH